MNTEGSIVDAARIEQAIMQRFSPTGSLKMERLARELNSFRIGELRPAARTWEIMMERDGDLSVPADKLFADIARLPWEIEKEDESTEAERHAESLKYFYTHLTATSVLDRDETGGVNLLLRQMMTAHAYRYSIHETVLQVSNAGRKEVTATFHHCPVYFFEARRGRLGFLKRDGDVYGEPLQPGEWLPAVGRGMMRQCSVGYVGKWGALADWFLYSYRFGLPGIHGETDAPKGSQEWNDFRDALVNFANDFVTLTNRGAKINLVEAAKGAGNTLPFQSLVERIDRLFARSFRGGDLSTQSREGGDVAGANPQEGEKQIILEDGGQWATDVLNARVDEPLIAYLYNARPKAWICIRPKKTVDINREISALKAARDLKIPVSIETARERLELPEPGDDEELIDNAEPKPEMPETENPEALANDTADQVATATAEILQPILDAYWQRLQAILTITDPALRVQRWNELKAELATLETDHLAEPVALVRALEQINTRAFVAGLQGKTAA